MMWSCPRIGYTKNRRRSRKTISNQHSGDYIPSMWVKCIDFNWRVHLQLQQPRRSSEDSNGKGNSYNSNNPFETQVHEEACNPHDKDEDEDEDDSTLPETEDDRGRDDILSKITEDDEKEMLQQNRMLLKLLFEQQAGCKKERTQMLSDLDRSRANDRQENLGNQSGVFKMVDPWRYCGGAKELDNFLQTLRSNFTSHELLFGRGIPDQVNDSRKVRGPSEWASDLWEAKDQCLESFDLFMNELQKMYGDYDRRLNPATKGMQEHQQLRKESVLVYAYHMKANCRRAGRNLITHQVVPYNLAWAGLRHALKTKSQTLDLHWQWQVQHTQPTVRLCGGLGVQTGLRTPHGTAIANSMRRVSQ